MSIKTRLAKLHPNIWVLSAGSFLNDISSEMLLNLLPLFLYSVLGVETAVVGLIEGVAETTSSLFKAYFGALSDRLGKRKWLAVAGYALSTVTKPLLYFANTWGWVLAVRFSDRVGKGIRTAPRDALLAASSPPERRGLAFGLHRAADTGGAFTGLAIATFIIWSTQRGATALTRPTFQIIVLASIIPAALAVLALIFGLREILMPTANAPAGGARQPIQWRKLGRPFLAFLAVITLFTLGNSSDAFITLRAQERGLNVLQIMGMLLTFNFVYTLLAGPAGILSDRFGRKRLLLLGWLVYGLIYLGLAAAQTGAHIWLLYGAYGLYYALTEGVAKALVADLVPAELRGSAYGLYNAAIGLAALPASLIAGILWQGVGSWNGFGPSAPFIFGATLALLAGGLLAVVVKR